MLEMLQEFVVILTDGLRFHVCFGFHSKFVGYISLYYIVRSSTNYRGISSVDFAVIAL